MGRFTYETTARNVFDDRVLAHLQLVIGSKLRRGESFFFTWKNDPSTGEGRTSVWMHQQAGLAFTFSGSRAPSISRTWVEALMLTANSPSGLHVIPEPPEAMPLAGGRASESVLG